jgi:hypothetical protein
MKNGGYPGNGTGIYDGCYRSLVAGENHAEESAQDKAPPGLCRYHDHYHCRNRVSV